MRANFRTAITIPERSWVRFRDVISEFAAAKQPPPGHGVSQSGGDVATSVSGGSGGDIGDGDKELSATTTTTTTTSVGGDSAVATSSVTAAANHSN